MNIYNNDHRMAALKSDLFAEINDLELKLENAHLSNFFLKAAVISLGIVSVSMMVIIYTAGIPL